MIGTTWDPVYSLELLNKDLNHPRHRRQLQFRRGLSNRLNDPNKQLLNLMPRIRRRTREARSEVVDVRPVSIGNHDDGCVDACSPVRDLVYAYLWVSP